MKKLHRHTAPDPQQLALQLDFFSGHLAPAPTVDSPATPHGPRMVPALPSTALTSAPSSATTAAPPAVRPGMRRLQLQDQLLEYSLRRSKRRSIGFMIDDEGLRVTAPKWVMIGEIESAIREKQRWILAKLVAQRERTVHRLQPPMQWRDGASLPYLGADITLRIVASHGVGVSYDAESRALTLCLPDDASEQQLKDRVQAWLQAEARRIFAERLPLYAEKLGVEYKSFALTSAMTQWGSCTADGRIRLNWRLMHFAMQQIDYVIAHELAHLREMNHSPRFWSTVQSVFPDFEAAKSALRERGPETFPVF